jgi:predicted translin family RNA/ssDNA-binding protein|tara:strand:- start:86 stop:301 length:216 start_codon:yes stop_codon:yes gene_type:complete
MIKLKDILQERIPVLPRINMGFGEAQSYANMMIKKSGDVIRFTRSGNMGKAKKTIKDMEEIVKQLKRVLGK